MITLLIIGVVYFKFTRKRKLNIILQRGLEIAELKEEEVPLI